MLTLKKPWPGEEAIYPDADAKLYDDDTHFAFRRHSE
jgi:hypothetical protein